MSQIRATWPGASAPPVGVCPWLAPCRRNSQLHPDDRFSWAAGQSTHYLRTHASKAIGSAPATRVQIGRLPSSILRPFSGFWANFPHFKLHPDDRFSWAAGQSTHYLRTHASKAIGSVAATRVQIGRLPTLNTSPIFRLLGQLSTQIFYVLSILWR